MNRPCFLVVDREFPGSISTRKLVIETAKLNVITAYSGAEALEIFGRFPAIDGVVLDGGIDDISCNELAGKLKTLDPRLPIIVIAAPDFDGCKRADFHVDTFNPAALLETLRSIKPKASAEIEKRNEALSREHLS